MDVRWGICPNAGGGGVLPGSDLGFDSRVSCGALLRTPWAVPCSKRKQKLLRMLFQNRAIDMPGGRHRQVVESLV